MRLGRKNVVTWLQKCFEVKESRMSFIVYDKKRTTLERCFSDVCMNGGVLAISLRLG